MQPGFSHTSLTLLACLLSLQVVQAQFVAHQNSGSINYYLYEPETTKDPVPLVIFLHGGGESGDDIELVKKHGIPKRIDQGKAFPFYVFAPQNPYKKGFWDDRVVDAVVDSLVRQLPIDPKRLYLVGLSRGGYGVWRMALNNPTKYAAMISVCPSSIPIAYIHRLEALPIWFFHGKKDDVIPIAVSKRGYQEMKDFNPNVRATWYPKAKHDSWTETFNNEEVYQWLLNQHLE